KSTAPAAAIAALYHGEHDPLLLVLPADHFIKDTARFAEIVNQAAIHAQSNYLVTFGVVPTKPETGYGYVKIADPVGSAYFVDQFVEKPDLETAKIYLDSKQYYWNSGMFMFRASRYLAELELYAPAIVEMCKRNMSHITKDLDFVRLNKIAFSTCPSDSIDYAVMEKTKNAVLVPLNTDWSDIGSWSALYEAHEPDHDGNVLSGDVLTENVKNSYLHAESRMLAVVGVSDHIIVETADAVLVAHKEHTQSIKNIVSCLRKNQRPEAELHRKVYRPWGYYETLFLSECFQVKRININAGACLSLQLHHHRSEHWVVVRGIAEVTRGEDVFLLSENESTYIPKKMKHRLANSTQNNLEIIEIQLGDYLDETDIVRFEDSYGRLQYV
ncbi:MAG TPA: mannose-1-phosphate guanylyltransferase/mannose-6-phosphate isomerase, partial [Gammaproteobacteria bacterium]|nr:mannose-1-phosphate guanylyltransferase/mannose-6-phosphate isomerase [Gammaproteobacteria bacterium]